MTTALANDAITVDHATVDVTELTPRLREGVRFVPVDSTPGTDYRIELPHSEQFLEVGFAEYALLSLFDGQCSVAEAMSLAARSFRDDALSLAEATEVIRWASSAGLFDSGTAKQSSHPSPWTIFGAVNPLWLKLPLPSPERLLDAIDPWLGWTQSRAVLPGAVLLLVAALVIGVGHAAEMTESFGGVLAISNWIPLAVCWTLLKIWHEIGHAISCRRYGVAVRRCGVVFILLAPCPYVDATEAWKLRSKWARVHIAAAGMVSELLIAALFVIAWPLLDSGLGWGLDPTWLKQMVVNVLFSATVATVLFNANPLMKFDGYYMLSDVADAPNLATRGSAASSARLAHLFFGDPIRVREPAWIELYGYCAAIWRVVVTVSLTAAASVLLPGVGLILGLFGAFISFAPPIINSLRAALERASIGRFGLRPILMTVAVAIVIASTLTAPWPFHLSAPAVVTLSDAAALRSPVEGVVRQTFVSAGDYVEAGQPLVELRNDELDSQHRALVAEIAQSEVRQRMLEVEDRLAEARVEQDNRLRLRTQQALLAEQRDDLRIEASHPGYVVANEPLSHRLGTLVREGDELVAIDDGLLEIRVAVPHRSVRLVRGREGQLVDVCLPTGELGSARIVRLAPAATTTPIDASLLTISGGPIATRSAGDSEEPETADPWFEMTLEPEQSFQEVLLPGMRLGVELNRHDSTARVMWREMTDWWDRLVEAERGAN